MADHVVGPDSSGFVFSPAAVVSLVLLSNATVVCFHLWTIVAPCVSLPRCIWIIFNVVQCNSRSIIPILSIPTSISWVRVLPDAAVIPRLHEVSAGLMGDGVHRQSSK